VDNVVLCFRTITDALTKAEVPWFAAFGTLISVVRSGVLLNPWDDDIDLMVDRDSFQRYLAGIPCAAVDRQGKCKQWDFPGNVQLSWKPTGMPYKVRMRGKKYPFVDINTFSEQNELAVVPPEELKSGHIKAFKVLSKLIYGETVMNVTPASDVGKIPNGLRVAAAESMMSSVFHDVNIPARYEQVLKLLYGHDVLERCQSSYTHERFCDVSSCENPMANHMPSITFPCCMLPDSLRRGVHKLSACR